MSWLERFYRDLAEGVIAAGGAYHEDKVTALHMAAEAWQALKEMGPDTYPCMIELHGLRYVFQWDLTPAVIVVMMWEEEMWQNMAFIEVPEELMV
jgi:hypothetical protein